ncbi:MAG TPA: efflux RND transporter periplasmic adaptor subunit [Marinobacter sp.]|nr:efflux RND transporter periplasmic adaptor subunit [Marinobacter sp.]
MKRLIIGLFSMMMLVSGTVVGQSHNELIPTGAVERAPLSETIELDGVVEAVQQSTVSAQTSGRVISLPFDVDDAVAAGDLIVQLDDSEQQARVNQAQAGLQETRAARLDAQQRLARTEQVHERGLVSQQELDQARNNLAAAQAREERAKATLAEAREQLSYTRIVAPYGGILTERHVELGEAVAPGQPLLSGLSLEQLRVVANLPQQYADLARSQRQAIVTLTDGRVLKTDSMTFYPYADPSTHTFRLRMGLHEPGSSLFPGMLVKVSVPVGTRNTLWIPDSSLIHRSELRAVFVLDEQNRPRLRQVRTGVHDNGRIEILAGLSEGESVVINPSALGQALGADRRQEQTQ